MAVVFIKGTVQAVTCQFTDTIYWVFRLEV